MDARCQGPGETRDEGPGVERVAGRERALGSGRGAWLASDATRIRAGPDGFEKTHASTRATELRAVESETATQGLGVNVSEVRVDECDRVRPGLEAAKLRMMAIAASATLKDLASKERFPPERCEALGIEISRVDGPQSHDAFPCAG